ncbi:hypothetical protein TNCV_3902601 [Trichonephila clavipes]|nr:hypothetical protein TNCV_3902601 [Trichonephila clavipes]
MISEISCKVEDGIYKLEIVNPDDPDQGNRKALLHYCIVFDPGQWYWARTRGKESHDPIPIPLGYRGHQVEIGPTPFGDEAHFWLNGYVNKQNCRIWSEANPQVYVETPLHPEKMTVWCTLWARGILLQKR